MPGPYQLLRPFIWVAFAAFILGFAGFLAIGGAVARASGIEEINTPPTATYYPDAGPVRIA